MVLIDEKKLLSILRKEIKACGSQLSWAKNNNISPQALNDVLRGRRKPAKSIARALGYERAVLFRKNRQGRRGSSDDSDT